MAAVSYISRGNTYRIEPITDHEKVDVDFLFVKANVDGISEEEYKNHMHDSIEQGYAYELYVNDSSAGFFYNSYEGNMYCSRSVWIDSEIEGVVVMLWHMFKITDAHKIVFAPHSDNLKYFKSLIAGSKIREYNAVGSPVTITRKHFEEVSDKLHKYLDIR